MSRSGFEFSPIPFCQLVTVSLPLSLKNRIFQNVKLAKESEIFFFFFNRQMDIYYIFGVCLKSSVCERVCAKVSVSRDRGHKKGAMIIPQKGSLSDVSKYILTLLRLWTIYSSECSPIWAVGSSEHWPSCKKN